MPTPSQAPDHQPLPPRQWSRRQFIQSLGLGVMATSVLASCRQSARYLTPSDGAPEWEIPGAAISYFTCYPDPRGAIPVKVVTRDGCPVQIMPSDRWPDASGLSAPVQATLRSLYDAKRSHQVLFHGKPVDEVEWRAALKSWSTSCRSEGRVALVIGEDVDPVRDKMVLELQTRNPKIRLFRWEPFSTRQIRRAAEAQWGSGAQLVPQVGKTMRLLALDCDFLGTELVTQTSDFQAHRIPIAERPDPLFAGDGQTKDARLYVAEGRLSLTGGNADHRLALLPSRIPALLIAVARVVGDRCNVEALRSLPEPEVLTDPERQWASRCAEDLAKHPRESLVMLGASYPEELHQLAIAVNVALQAPGSTLSVLKGTEWFGEELDELPQALQRRELDVVFFLGVMNPVWSTPRSWKLAELLQKSGVESVHLGAYVDETARACTWHFPATHYLESWGVSRDVMGRCCYRQPIVQPLFHGVSVLELLGALTHSQGKLVSAGAGEYTPDHEQVRKFFRKQTKNSSPENAWLETLRRGFSPESAYPAIHSTPQPLSQEVLNQCVCLAGQGTPLAEDEVEIQIVPDYALGDGRGLPNEWLRELSDPITGLAWDPGVQMAQDQQSATRQPPPPDVGNYLRLSLTGTDEVVSKSVVCLIPGMPAGLLVLTAGYGWSWLGEGDSDQVLGSAPYALYSDKLPAWFRQRFQGTWSQADERSLALMRFVKGQADVPVSTLAEQEALPRPALQPYENPLPRQDNLHQWGMSIDLSRCIGCNACLIACQAENNIPTVGRAEVARGRVMHWIRIDRYFQESESGRPLQAYPIACQQCEKAPCESVCPVNATVHGSEGINAMTYARCWGTRYCAANCPYRARRFNFFDYAKRSEEETREMRNPNVTVRDRGVMEKCTYCVQRIQEAKINHKARLADQVAAGQSVALELTDADLRLPEGAVQTACQQACPMGAIEFGNLLLSTSRVNTLRNSPRATTPLPNSGTHPRTSYLSPLTNPVGGS